MYKIRFDISHIKGETSGALFFAAYIGPSMNPTLCEPEILEIVPYGSRPIQVGDVVFFTPHETDQAVIHRVIRVTLTGISTRGDNNSQEDIFLLQPKDIKGRVVAAWRGQERREIAGGWRGLLTSRWLRWQRTLDRDMSRLLHPVYYALAHWGIVARIIPSRLRPRIVVFQTNGHSHRCLLFGRLLIGRYDDQQREWEIKRPFRLFVDKRVLANSNDKD